MSISSHSVIHYTDTLDKLKGILKEGFRIKYCLEVVTGVDSAFPMVSFCDIPLSQVKEHMSTYGYYGIGLSKKWANVNALNPVLYVNNSSYIDDVLKRQSDKINETVKSTEKFDWEWLYQFISILSFVKPYEGDINKGGTKQHVTFYNEREWRYVPTREEIKQYGQPQIYGPTYESRKDAFNKSLESMRLKFDISDISYLIISDEVDIHQMIDFITNTFTSAKQSSRELLFTKILTRSQIENDL